jgi:predicted ATPase
MRTSPPSQLQSGYLDWLELSFPENIDPKRLPGADDYDEDDEDAAPPDPAALREEYPFTVPAIRALAELGRIEFHPRMTFFIGENGTGKSTLLEAIADLRKLDKEGGSKNFRWDRENFAELRPYLSQSRCVYPAEEYFLRAESFYNVSQKIDELEVKHAYGGRSLLERSHGEGFMALLAHRLEGKGLYLFDEPEAALSVQSQFTALGFIKRLINRRSQFIIATHSPILLAYPDAWIYRFTGSGIERVSYEESDPYVLTRAFLENPRRMLDQIFGD